jgi:hypothetical protein
MKKTLLALCLTPLLTCNLLAESYKDFLIFVGKSRNREEICSRCIDFVRENQQTPVQNNLICALIAGVVENNPRKALNLSIKATEVYREKHKENEKYEKNLKKLQGITRFYQKSYEETKKALKNELTEEEMNKWEEGVLVKSLTLIDQAIAEGRLSSIFSKDSPFVRQIERFDNQ